MKKVNRRSKQQATTIVDDDSSSPPPSVDVSSSSSKHHDLSKTVVDLQQQNDSYKREIEELRSKMGTVTLTSDDGVQKLKENYLQKLNALEEQVVELKRKLNAQNQLSAYKHRPDTAAKNFNEEIQRLKAQKVQLQCKMKLESVQYRLQKASLEKELLQLKKEQRRNKHEMHKLLVLNQMMKLVLQRKTTAASVSRKNLQELLESRKAISRRRSGSKGGNQENQRELEATLCVQEVCAEYERQMEDLSSAFNQNRTLAKGLFLSVIVARFCLTKVLGLRMVNEVNNLKAEAGMLEEDDSRCQLLDEESASEVKDSELRDMKEEVARLGRLVSQMGLPKPQPFDKGKPKVLTSERKVPLSQSSASVGSNSSSVVTDTSESDHSIRIRLPQSKESCCSCSKKSLCKTTKCGCRAAGGSCGNSCGCSASKCSNREAVNSNDSADVAATKKPLCNIKNTLVNAIVGQPGQKRRGTKSVKQNTTSELPGAAV
ncbi:kinesin-like protein KIN-4C [Rutidosis leptorrhynchoides]|uniref:kinesin-like protein KIN-4C n=1 Tax=Rutidosis leptorrhynchoides TaxID=125765 RepID=UPI003A98D14E